MAATPWASDRNWELVFEDGFDGSSLNEHNWSRIDYVGYNAPDWRKYQSRGKPCGIPGKRTATPP